MKRLYSIFFLIFAFSLIQSETVLAQSITIEQINKSPEQYDNEVVEVSGLVRQHVEEDQISTDYYVLTGDYGGFIRVLTSEGLPETNRKYTISGILLRDATNLFYFISEQSRSLAEPVIGSITPQEIVVPQREFPLLTVIIIAGAIILIILLYLIFAGRKNNIIEEPNVSKEEYTVGEETGNFNSEQYKDDFKTIKVQSGTPKTLVFIPGELKIISGEDSGKSFRIAPFATPAGNVVSIGREKVSGEREYSHIQLTEKTVSRKQAEIIQKDGKLMVKNLSETNFTKVDGVELKPGETVDLQPNSTIRTGEVEFQYLA